MIEPERNEEGNTGQTGKSGGRLLLAGWLLAAASPVVLTAGSWLYVFPAQLQRGGDLVWSVTLLLAGGGFISGLASLVKRRWLGGVLLVLGSILLFGVGLALYGVLVLLYFGVDPG